MSQSLAAGLFWISVACCAVAQFFIVRSVLGTHHVPEPTSHLPKSRDALELFWAVLPAAGLVVLLYFTWRVIP